MTDIAAPLVVRVVQGFVRAFECPAERRWRFFKPGSGRMVCECCGYELPVVALEAIADEMGRWQPSRN